MPARAAMQDEITTKLKNAVARDVVTPTCCFKTCKRGAAVLVIVRFKDQSTDVYGLCVQDFAKVRAASPVMLDKSSRQGVFLYS